MRRRKPEMAPIRDTEGAAPEHRGLITVCSMIATLMQALKLYRLDNKAYPTTEQGLQALVQKLAHRLVSLYSRRRRVANRGQLDLRGTLRRNLRHDGLLFDTVWKRTRSCPRPLKFFPVRLQRLALNQIRKPAR